MKVGGEHRLAVHGRSLAEGPGGGQAAEGGRSSSDDVDTNNEEGVECNEFTTNATKGQGRVGGWQ